MYNSKLLFKIIGLCALCACLSSIATPSSKGIDSIHWQATDGPYGGIIKSVAQKPGDDQTFFASAFGSGIYISKDAGQHWSLTSPDSPLYVKELVYLNSLLMAVTNSRVYFSVDDGSHWKSLPTTGIPANLTQLAYYNNQLYLGSLQTLSEFDPHQKQWVHAKNFPDHVAPALLASGKQLFVGTDAGMYVTNDGGNTWQALQNGLPSGNTIYNIDAVGNQIFAVTNTLNGVALYRSDNNGRSWIPSDYGLSNYDLSTITHQGNTIYVGTKSDSLGAEPIGLVFKSTDGGNYWQQLSLNSYAINQLLPTTQGMFVASSSKLALLSKNDANWQEMDTGITGQWIYNLLITNNGDYIAGNSIGEIFYSDDLGKTWARGQGITPGSFANSVNNLTQASDGTLYFVNGVNNVIYRSDDGGQNWQRFGIDSSKTYIFPTAIYAGKGVVILGTAGSGIYLSTDRGHSWKPLVGDYFTHFIRAIAMIGNKIYVGTNIGYIWESNVDEIDQWDMLDQPRSRGPTMQLQAVPTADNKIALFVLATATDPVSDEAGIFSTVDNGKTWVEYNSALPTKKLHKLLIDGNTWYLATNDKGVFVSTDQGKSWQPVSDGLPANSTVFDISRSGDDMILGTQTGVYRQP